MYQEIRDSLVKSGVSFRANDNISENLSPEQKAALETEVEAAVQNLLNVLVIDTANDHNTNETARRVAKIAQNSLSTPTIPSKPHAKQSKEMTGAQHGTAGAPAAAGSRRRICHILFFIHHLIIILLAR